MKIEEQDTPDFMDNAKPVAMQNTSHDATIKEARGLKKLVARIKNFFANPKKRLIFIITTGLVIIILVGLILFRSDPKDAGSGSKSASNDSATEVVAETAANILDGTAVPKDLAVRHPLGVIIENHVDARPQSGLSSASIIYEAIAEGGITRYLALFSGYNATKIGPIRSARTYYVDLALEYNAYLAHVGGNYDALESIPAKKVLDLDQFKNAAAYYRDAKKGKSSEHTMYSSTDKLYSLATAKGYTTVNNFPPLIFTTAPVAGSGLNQKISIEYGGAQYTSRFDYNTTSNSYDRTNGTLPDQDIETGKRLSPKNLIIQTVSRAVTKTKINETGYAFTLAGEGSAKILQNGKMISGSWKKSGNNRTIFYDDKGAELILIPGQSWICLVHPDTKVTIE